jgi:hypothetical protein
MNPAGRKKMQGREKLTAKGKTLRRGTGERKIEDL